MSTTLITSQPVVAPKIVNTHAAATLGSKQRPSTYPAIQGSDTPLSTDTRDPIELALLARALEVKTASIIERMLSQPMGAQIVLWNSGCIQLDNKNIMIQADDAVVMYARLKSDPRFLMVEVVHLDEEKKEWKAVYRCDRGLA